MINEEIRIKFKKSGLIQSTNFYTLQYIKAIEGLLKNKDFENYVLPLINLIHQYIENSLKILILGTEIDFFTTVDMKINTHNLKELVNDEFLLPNNLKKINEFNKNYELLKLNVYYFANLLGANTFLNSRYPIKKDKILTSINDIKINKNEFKRNFFSLTNCIEAHTIYLIINNMYIGIKTLMRINNSTFEKEMSKFLKDNNFNFEEFQDIIKVNLIKLNEITRKN